VFRDEDTEWFFDLQLDRFASDDEEIGDLFSEDDSDELVEVNVSQLDRLAGLDIGQLGFLEPRGGSRFLLSSCKFQTGSSVGDLFVIR
jgi:hypothetical protein